MERKFLSNKYLKKKELHDIHERSRHDRFSKGIFGKVEEPVIQKNIIGYWEQPTYLASADACAHLQRYKKTGHIACINDYRCFYTGVRCLPGLKTLNDYDPRKVPWVGNKDHLVPKRRFMNCPIDYGSYKPPYVWSCNVANSTLGAVPLPIRLKIRQWLSTTYFPRDDLSIENGLNIKWIIISMLQDFKIKDRYPWSRKLDKTWWYPEISEPLMKKWWAQEKEFLELDNDGRNNWIEKFVYHF